VAMTLCNYLRLWAWDESPEVRADDAMDLLHGWLENARWQSSEWPMGNEKQTHLICLKKGVSGKMERRQQNSSLADSVGGGTCAIKERQGAGCTWRSGSRGGACSGDDFIGVGPKDGYVRTPRLAPLPSYLCHLIRGRRSEGVGIHLSQ
jgi:hypothetical protein